MEANPEELKSVAEYEEVPKEEAALKSLRALKNWHEDWHLAVGRHGQLKKRTQGDGGFRKKLSAACRGMTPHAIPAWHQGHSRQRPGKDSVVQGTQKGQMFRKRRRAQLVGGAVIRVKKR
jgi:hypothetical protein